MLARRAAGKAVAAVVLLVIVVAGCGLIRGTISTVRALQRAGFSSARIQTGNPDSFEVKVRKDTEDLDAAAIDAAGVVWRKLPLRIERLQVQCENGFGGKGTFVADRAQLEQRFGARDPDLDRGFRRSDLRTVAIVVGVLVVGGLLVLGGIVALVVVLIRRSRRRPPPPGPFSQHPPPGYGPLA